MSGVGYGPLWRIDGPSPQAPAYTLVGASRVVQDIDQDQIERWINGVVVDSYPTDLAFVHDACATGTDRIKVEGGVRPLPEFGAMTVYLAETCFSASLFGEGLSNAEAQARYVARAQAAFAAVESAAIEREFATGDVLGNNPHLGDGNGNFPWGDTPTTMENGFAVLENEIAVSGRRGFLHVTPGLLTAASYKVWVIPDRAGVLRTLVGTTVVPGSGYVDTGAPDGGHASPTATQEWAYATGPVEIRRTDPFLIPDQLSQALDRTTNTVTYRVERYYVVDWDTAVQSAVLIDRCTSTCGSP